MKVSVKNDTEGQNIENIWEKASPDAPRFPQFYAFEPFIMALVLLGLSTPLKNWFEG